MTAWTGSSDEAEAGTIEAILKAFDPDEVAASFAGWERELKEGGLDGHDTFPSH